MAKRRLGAIKRNDFFKVTEADRRSRVKGSSTYGGRTMTVTVNIDRDTRWSGSSKKAIQSKQYIARACVRGKANRCALAHGNTPTKAVQAGLRKLSTWLGHSTSNRTRATADSRSHRARYPR